MTDRPTYPDMPGWKGNKSTGRQAAFAVAKDLGRRQNEVLRVFWGSGEKGATCDIVAEELGLPVHLVRPRASELEKKGRLFAIGKWPGDFGHPVTLYSTVDPRAASKAA